ncbi:MAG: amidohydrolase family protein, partial [Planctomycetota bacterium]
QVSRGVTGFVLATLASPVDELLTYLVGMSTVLDAPEGSEAFLGGLVEGTFMNPAFHGAHNPRWVFPPEVSLLERIIQTRAVRMLNVAPEVSPKSIELIEFATKAGVVVGCGHAKPHAECVRDAVAAGLRYVIHLGNGPTGSNLKRFHDGGLLEETLRNDGLIATLIIDGFHVHPALLRDWIERKEISRTVGVSDAGFAMGPPEGDFEVFGIRGATSEGREYLYVRPGDELPNPRSSDASPLFGSAIDQLRVFENTVNLLATERVGVYYREHAALGLDDAFLAAQAICSKNPAALLGLHDRGEIEVGQRADVFLASVEGAPGAIRVTPEAVWVAGARR